MKRSIVATAAASMVLGLAGCSEPGDAPSRPAAEASGWVTPPMIESVVRNGASLTVRGHAAPLGRVVLRSAVAAYAVGADDQGRFEIRVAAPSVDTLMVVETQTGEDAAPAPYRLLVAHDPAGPVALLAPGSASVRLDPGPVLDALDSDGRTLAASGRAAPGRRVTIAIPGAAPASVTADARGRWMMLLDAPAGADPATVTVDGVAFAYPGAANGTGHSGLLARAGGGWRAIWAIGPRGRQSSWFPQP